MGKGVKTVAAMKRSHPAVPYSSKGQTGDDLTDQGVIHDYGSGAYVLDQPLLQTTIPGEQVKDQGLWPAPNKGQCLVEFSISNDRQDGAEYLLLQNSGIRRQVCKNCWCYVTIVLVRRAADRNAAFLQEGKQASKVGPIHDPPIGVAASGIGSVKAHNRRLNR